MVYGAYIVLERGILVIANAITLGFLLNFTLCHWFLNLGSGPETSALPGNFLEIQIWEAAPSGKESASQSRRPTPIPKPPATSLHPIPLGCPRALTLGAQLHAFSWRTIALQCCIGSAIQQCESAMCIHVSPPS